MFILIHSFCWGCLKYVHVCYTCTSENVVRLVPQAVDLCVNSPSGINLRYLYKCPYSASSWESTSFKIHERGRKWAKKHEPVLCSEERNLSTQKRTLHSSITSCSMQLNIQYTQLTRSWFHSQYFTFHVHWNAHLKTQVNHYNYIKQLYTHTVGALNIATKPYYNGTLSIP